MPLDELPPHLAPDAVPASGRYCNATTGMEEFWYVDPATGAKQWVGSVPGEPDVVDAFERMIWPIFLRDRFFRVIR